MAEADDRIGEEEVEVVLEDSMHRETHINRVRIVIHHILPVFVATSSGIMQLIVLIDCLNYKKLLRRGKITLKKPIT